MNYFFARLLKPHFTMNAPIFEQYENEIFDLLKSLRIKDYTSEINYFDRKKDGYRAEKAEEKRKDFISFCKYASKEDILIELGHRLTDYYQILAGYYYTIAEDFPANPWLKIRNLKKAAICCNKLKEIEPRAQIYNSRYICQRNRNYLN